MLFLYLLCFEIKGKWNGLLKTSRNEETNFVMRARKTKEKTVCSFLVNGTSEYIPNKVNIKELKSDKHYALLIPSKKRPMFAEFFFQQSKSAGTFISTANSTDSSWTIDLSVVPMQSIELKMKKIGKSQWVSYSLARAEKESIKLYIALAGITALVTASLSCLRRKSKAD